MKVCEGEGELVTDEISDVFGILLVTYLKLTSNKKTIVLRIKHDNYNCSISLFQFFSA